MTRILSIQNIDMSTNNHMRLDKKEYRRFQEYKTKHYEKKIKKKYRQNQKKDHTNKGREREREYLDATSRGPVLHWLLKTRRLKSSITLFIREKSFCTLSRCNAMQC